MDVWTTPQCAKVSVVDDVEWSDTHSPRYESIWTRPDTLPEVNAHRCIKLCAPLPVALEFWCIFQPALSTLNGWSEHPEELEHSALVQVEVLEKLQQDWLKVKVKSTIPFPQLADHFPPSCAKELDFLPERFYPSTEHVNFNDWHYVHSSFESDLGFWTVFTDDGVNLSILLYGHYMVGSPSRAYAGNCLLSDAEHQHFLGLLSSSKKMSSN